MGIANFFFLTKSDTFIQIGKNYMNQEQYKFPNC